MTPPPKTSGSKKSINTASQKLLRSTATVKSTRKTTKARKPPTSTVQQSAPQITVADARLDTAEERLNKIDEKMEKHHGEQRNLIVTAIVAVVFIVASVAVEVIIFNANYNDNLIELQKQHEQDYRSLRDAMDGSEDEWNERYLDLNNDKQDKIPPAN